MEGSYLPLSEQEHLFFSFVSRSFFQGRAGASPMKLYCVVLLGIEFSTRVVLHINIVLSYIDTIEMILGD